MVLSADLGGTSVRLVLYVDGGEERARVEGPGGPMRLGHGAQIAERLARLARPLLSREGIARADAFVIGAAGVGRDAERLELEKALAAERLAWKVLVTTDAELARAAAFGGGPGVLLIAGTGSIALGVDASGTLTRVGGLGWRIGDQGSAYWLGARALEAVGAMHDRIGPVTHLAESLAAAVGVKGIAGLVRWSTIANTAEVAALGSVVVSTADQGDGVASAIVDLAVELLGKLATAAGAGALPVALSGGLIAPDRPLRERLTRHLVERQRVSVLETPVDPCRGGPVLAERLTQR
jgi:N-acetylglucosamine kinase-like BadF-type ATPase